MRVSVLLVDAPALFDNLCDLGLAALYSFSVGSNGVLAGYDALRRMRSCALCVKVVGKDGKRLAGVPFPYVNNVLDNV